MYEAFVINLDRHPERLSFMRQQFQAIGLDFTRVDAVDGTIATDTSSFQVASYAPLSAGEIGCFESHRKAWQMIVDRDLPAGLVLEDDVAIASDLGSLEFDPDLLKEADIIKIDTHTRPSLQGEVSQNLPGTDRSIRRLLGSENSASGYLMTRRGAERLLAKSQNYVQPVDLFLFHDDYSAFIQSVIWKLAPTAVTQIKFTKKGDRFSPELRDGIQTNRRSNKDPRLQPKGLMGLRLRMRRFLDGDTKIQRKRRHMRFVQNVAPAQGTVFEAIPYHSGADVHTNEALKILSIGEPTRTSEAG